MKQINIKTIIGTTILMLFLGACTNILDEQPRSIFEPGFFKTEQGVNGGLTSLYAHLRYIYGNAYFYNSGVTGTDEATYAQSADANFKVMDVSGQGKYYPNHRRGYLAPCGTMHSPPSILQAVLLKMLLRLDLLHP